MKTRSIYLNIPWNKPKNTILSKEYLKEISGLVKLKGEKSVEKLMATIVWDSKLMLIDFLKEWKMVAASHYEGVLKKL